MRIYLYLTKRFLSDLPSTCPCSRSLSRWRSPLSRTISILRFVTSGLLLWVTGTILCEYICIWPRGFCLTYPRLVPVAGLSLAEGRLSPGPSPFRDLWPPACSCGWLVLYCVNIVVFDQRGFCLTYPPPVPVAGPSLAEGRLSPGPSPSWDWWPPVCSCGWLVLYCVNLVVFDQEVSVWLTLHLSM